MFRIIKVTALVAALSIGNAIPAIAGGFRGYGRHGYGHYGQGGFSISITPQLVFPLTVPYYPPPIIIAPPVYPPPGYGYYAPGYYLYPQQAPYESQRYAPLYSPYR